MASPRCFVRVWHDKKPCRHTGRPVLVATYRLAFEAFSLHTACPKYELVFYNSHTRQRVDAVSQNQGFLRLVLCPEPFLRGKEDNSGHQNDPEATATVGMSNRGKMKKIVALKVSRLRDEVTVVEVSVAYALDRYDKFRMDVRHQGSDDVWINDAFLVQDGESVEESHADVPDGVDVCIEF